MPTPVRAAVLPAAGAPVRVVEIALPDPGPGQVRVRLAAAGICHTDRSVRSGVLRHPMPAVLGHEGTGTVVATGPGVDHPRTGDRVLLNWLPACGACPYCRISQPHLCGRAAEPATRPYAALPGGGPVHPGLGLGTFAEQTVVDASAALPLPEGMPLVESAVTGCSVLTGFGAVHREARVRPGESVAVFGVGGVGMSVLAAARIAGAGPVIAVDVEPGKEPLARAQGATDFLVSRRDTGRRIRALTGGLGADHAFECGGGAATVRAAWAATRRGGRTTVLGIGAADDLVSFSAMEIFQSARTLAGSVFGGADPRTDLPVVAGHLAAGRLRLDHLIGHRIGLDEVPDALAAPAAGGRTLVALEA